MMYKAKEYDGVRSSSYESFKSEVNRKLKQGWFLYGEMVISNEGSYNTCYYHQPLAKYEDPFTDSELPVK